MKLTYPPGATPLNPDEVFDLIPTHISEQNELNEWEQLNILQARKWVFARKRTDILDIQFCQQLHKRMFNETWKWAGKFRKSNKNIGVFWEQVPTQVKLLLDDLKYQLSHSTFPVDEMAARLHHRLALVHPFPNGNGRHARLMADVFLFNQGKKAFSWGSKNLIEAKLGVD